MNNFRICAGIALGAALLLPSTEAHAWTKIRNNFTSTINVAYSFTSIHGPAPGCGYVTCDDNTRSMGWFVLAPGQEATVNTHDHGNGYHMFFAFDDQGGVWSGGDSMSVIFDQAFDFCWNLEEGFPKPGTELVSGFNGGDDVCCGLVDCLPYPDDVVIPFNP